MAKNRWFSIKAQANVNAAAEIYIYGDIGDSWWEETVGAADFVRELNALKNEEVHIRINSIGGSVPDGLAIHNAIRRHPSKITIYIDGMAMSIASLIAMAAECHMAENAILMIHAPWAGNVSGNAKALREYADQLDSWAAAMATSYAKKSGMAYEDILAMITDGADHYYTAAEAQAAGFVDAITEALPIAASARINASDLARYQGLPTAANAFVIHAAKPATSPEDITMGREEKIRAKFQPHAAKPGVDALLQEILADESITPEAAGEKLNALLAAPAAKGSEDEDTITAKALAAEKQRRQAVRAQFQPFAAHEGMVELLDTCLDDHTVTPEAAGQKILAKLAADTQPVGATHVHITQGANSRRMQDEIVASVIAKAGLADDKTRELAMASGFRNYSLLDFARASLSRAGVTHQHMDKMALVAAAFTQSTSDFPILLENAMHKVLLNAYATAPDTWTRFCKTGSVSDFRAHNRYRTGSLGNLDPLNELGEFTNKTIPDAEKASIAVGTRGNVINLSRQAIINDDLGAFVGLAAMLGRSAKRTIEAAVYSLLGENAGLGPHLADGNPLFHNRGAGKNNIGSNAALSVDALEADRVVMGSQVDVSGNEFLDLRPAVLLVPLGLGGTARVINDAQYDPDTSGKLQRPNMVRGLFRDIVDTPRLTGKRRYLFADPNETPVIEVAFLDGIQEPFIEQQSGFTVDGAQYKVRLDFGVAALDYRGAVTNAGG